MLEVRKHADASSASTSASTNSSLDLGVLTSISSSTTHSFRITPTDSISTSTSSSSTTKLTTTRTTDIVLVSSTPTSILLNITDGFPSTTFPITQPTPTPVFPTAQPTPAAEYSSNSKSTVVKVVAGVGAVFAVLTLLIAAWIFFKRRKDNHQRRDAEKAAFEANSNDDVSFVGDREPFIPMTADVDQRGSFDGYPGLPPISPSTGTFKYTPRESLESNSEMQQQDGYRLFGVKNPFRLSTSQPHKPYTDPFAALATSEAGRSRAPILNGGSSRHPGPSIPGRSTGQLGRSSISLPIIPTEPFDPFSELVPRPAPSARDKA